jgi:hypothetical protein
MNSLNRFAFLVCVFAFVACGNVPPTNTNPVDSGSHTDLVDASLPPTDHGPSTDVPSAQDHPTPPVDAAPTVCVPTETATCNGATLCEPNMFNPTCAGASACQCDMSDANVPAVCHTSAVMMRACHDEMSCSPGANHCSVDLPAGVNYAPFTYDPQFFTNGATPAYNLGAWYEPDGHGGRRSTGYGWYNENREEMSFGSDVNTLRENAAGFRVISVAATINFQAATGETGMYATCSGSICYWNRSPSMAATHPSLEITFLSPCAISVRGFNANGQLLPGPAIYTARRPDC